MFSMTEPLVSFSHFLFFFSKQLGVPTFYLMAVMTETPAKINVFSSINEFLRLVANWHYFAYIFT